MYQGLNAQVKVYGYTHVVGISALGRAIIGSILK